MATTYFSWRWQELGFLGLRPAPFVGGCEEADSVKGLGSSHLLRGESGRSSLPLSGSQEEVWPAVQFSLAGTVFFG